MTIQVIDSPQPAAVAAKAKQLHDAGVRAAILYISPINLHGPKTVRKEHVAAIRAAGIDIGFVCEGWGGSDNFAHDDINAATGRRDGAICSSYLDEIGAPVGTAVYPTVDNDASPAQIKNLCLPYFQAFRAALDAKYRLGAYGCGALLFALEDAKLVDLPWLSNAMGWSRSREYDQTLRWAIKQRPETKLLDIDIDADMLNPDKSDFGFWKATAAPAVAVTAPAPAAASNATDVDAITAIATASPVMTYNWHGRGTAPAAFVRGMALTFAQTYRRLLAGHPAALEMAKANTHDDQHDALAHYRGIFDGNGMSNEVAGADTLRHLFVLMFGHAMRESSGQYCCGWDTEKDRDPLTSDSAEAGLFQTSYNAHTCHPTFDQVMAEFTAGTVEGFGEVFSVGVHCAPPGLQNFGSGAGAAFQKLCKDKPAFAVESAAITLRNLCRHYGPIIARAAEVRPEVDAMLRAVQAHVDAA